MHSCINLTLNFYFKSTSSLIFAATIAHSLNQALFLWFTPIFGKIFEHNSSFVVVNLQKFCENQLMPVKVATGNLSFQNSSVNLLFCNATSIFVANLKFFIYKFDLFKKARNSSVAINLGVTGSRIIAPQRGGSWLLIKYLNVRSRTLVLVFAQSCTYPKWWI